MLSPNVASSAGMTKLRTKQCKKMCPRPNAKGRGRTKDQANPPEATVGLSKKPHSEVQVEKPKVKSRSIALGAARSRIARQLRLRCHYEMPTLKAGRTQGRSVFLKRMPVMA